MISDHNGSNYRDMKTGRDEGECEAKTQNIGGKHERQIFSNLTNKYFSCGIILLNSHLDLKRDLSRNAVLFSCHENSINKIG